VVLFWFLIQRSCKMPLKCIAGSWSFWSWEWRIK
jgi:hypothetical protein